MKLCMIVEVPDDLAEVWLQHMRDFEFAHAPHCQFRVLAATGRSVENMLKTLDFAPPVTGIKVVM